MTITMTMIITILAFLLLAADGVALLLRGGSAGGSSIHGRLRPVLRLVLAALLLATLAVRSVEIGFFAFFGRHNSMVLFSALILATTGIMEFRLNRGRTALPPAVSYATGIVAVVFLALASSPLVSDVTGPVLPALRSAWLPIHIVFTFVGEAFFTVAFAGSIVWLWKSYRGEESPALDDLVYRSIAVGYGLFTMGALVFGAVWARQAWGRYWGWDPKETWALITWIVYSVYLHGRLRRWGQGRVSHWLSVLGYLTAVFTFLGVNLLYRSLHTY